MFKPSLSSVLISSPTNIELPRMIEVSDATKFRNPSI